MKVTDKDVAYVADLANLDLTVEERVHMLRDLNSILEYIERLSELETSEVAPMAQVSDRYGVDETRQGSDRFAYAIREDVKDGLRESLPHEVAVENAPDTDGTFFEVPKVIER
ncbi:MAG: Asp-tRNA(Asn)/Glu-tRNA(Gln) amidotransferase subunit GatC [Terriglobales bacterium]